MAQLLWIDYAVLVAYFLIIFGIGYYYARQERTSAEYFLAGRDVAWWAIGASLFSSNIGSEHFIGLAGSGAASGMAVGHFEWLASLMVLMLGWIFVPFYLRSNVYTNRKNLYEYRTQRDSQLLEHQAIFEAIMARDPVRAREAAGLHMTTALRTQKEIQEAEKRLEASIRRLAHSDLVAPRKRRSTAA